MTRFASLRGVEQLVKAGIPVVTSITFGRGALSGAPISASNGHLVVVVGFTSGGDVVVNDPASRTRGGVRRTYDRGQFENAWLQRYPTAADARLRRPGLRHPRRRAPAAGPHRRVALVTLTAVAARHVTFTAWRGPTAWPRAATSAPSSRTAG